MDNLKKPVLQVYRVGCPPCYGSTNTPNRLKLDPTGKIYNENNRGTKIDPWGTPQVTWAAVDEWAPKLMEKLLFDGKKMEPFYL